MICHFSRVWWCTFVFLLKISELESHNTSYYSRGKREKKQHIHLRLEYYFCMLMYTYDNSYSCKWYGKQWQLSLTSLVRHFSRSQNMTYIKNSINPWNADICCFSKLWTVLWTISDEESPSFLIALPTVKMGLNVMTRDQSPKMMIQTSGPITVNGSSAIDFIMSGFQLLRSLNCPKHLSPCFCFTAELKACPELQP